MTIKHDLKKIVGLKGAPGLNFISGNQSHLLRKSVWVLEKARKA